MLRAQELNQVGRLLPRAAASDEGGIKVPHRQRPRMRYDNGNMEQLLAALPVIMDTLETILHFDVQGKTKFRPVAKPAFTMILGYLRLFGWAMQGCDSVARLLFQPSNSCDDHFSRCVERFIEIESS